MRAAAVRRGAAFLRATPDFPGKARVGSALHGALGRPAGPVEVTMKDGSRLILDPASRTEASSVWTGRYDHRLVAYLASTLRANAVALDVGANVGFYTVPLARRLLELGGTVHAFEPLAANHARLAENIALNGAATVARAWHSAVGRLEGTVELEPELGAPTGNAASFPVTSVRPGRETSPLTTLDAFAARERLARCDLVKIDVEGGELSVLVGAAGLLAGFRPLVVLELNRYWMERFDWTLADLQAFAAGHGYRVRRWDGARFDEPVRELDELENVALVP